MQISETILKHYLKNVMFITGTACAGKSTMVKMLGENNDCIPDGILTPDQYSNICYLQTYNQVAVMLSPQSMSVEYFFDRNDPDKIFIKEQIMKACVTFALSA